MGPSTSTSLPSALSAALDYAARGWRTVPLPIRHDGHASDGKSPAMASWQLEASTDGSVIAEWWRRWPTANVGLLCDASFGFAVDIDDLDIIDFLPEFPATLTSRTPSGGCHLVYRHPARPLGNDVAGLRAAARDNGWAPRADASGKARGIDVRGKGGQIVVWPSISPSLGTRWQWVDPAAPIADAPAWLLSTLGSGKSPKKSESSSLPLTSSSWGQGADPYVMRALEEVVSDLAATVQGQRGTRLFWAAARLGELGVSHGEAEVSLLGACSSNGLVAKDGEASVKRELRRGWEQGAANPAQRPVKSVPVLHAKASKVTKPVKRDVLPTGKAPVEPLEKLIPEGVDPCTDLANAHRMVGLWKDDLRFVHSWGKWLAWDGRRWQVDGLGLHSVKAKETTKRVFAEAAALFDAGATDLAKERHKFAVRSQSSGAIQSMVTLARSDERVVVSHEEFDNDPWSLSVANGVVNLTSGTLGPHDRASLITRQSPVAYRPEATCPTWDAFLSQIMETDEALVSYLRRLVGYALTGAISEHVLVFFYGGGANGKSTFLSVIRYIMGDYAAHAPRGLLFQKMLGHPTELTDLCGRRFVTCAETGVNDAFDEPLVKDLTGGEPIRARRMREDFWEFKPTHKLFIAGNHKPRVHGDDNAIWRRFRLVPFNVSIPPEARDPWLTQKLIAEAPGILAWAVRGSLEWQRIGLADPQRVTDATEEYRRDSDALGEFFDSRLRFDAAFRVLKRDLTDALRMWTDDRGVRPISGRYVSAKLKERGVRDSTMRTGMGTRDCWQGVTLASDE